MKKIVKVNAILTRVTLMNNSMPQYSTMQKYGPLKTPKLSYFSYHVGNKAVTSENSLPVRPESQEGHRMTVWYVENKPKKVYHYKISAMLFG